MPPCGRHGHRVEEVVRRLQTTSCYPCHRVAPSRGDGRSDHGFRREAIVADDVHEPGDDLQVFYARAVCFRDLSGEALTDRYDVIKLKTAGPTRWPKRVAMGVHDIDVFSVSSLGQLGDYLPIRLFSSILLLAFGRRHACTYA